LPKFSSVPKSEPHVKSVIPLLLVLVVLSQGAGKVSTRHFDVYFDEGAGRTATMIAAAAEEARAKTRRVLGIRAEKRIVIRVKSFAGDFAEGQPGEHVPGWAVGTAYASRNTIFIMQPRGIKLKYTDITEVVTHEYVHVATGNYLEAVDMPRWLDEGLADFVGGARSWTAPLTLGTASITGRLIPMAELKNHWPQSAEAAGLAYAQSSDFVAFIEREYGPGAIRKLLKTARSTGDLDAAFRRVAGKGVYELESEWIGKMTRRYKWIPILSGGVTLWAMASVLVVIGYMRKRRMRRLKYQLWEMEERLAGFLARDDDDDDPPPSGKTTYH